MQASWGAKDAAGLRMCVHSEVAWQANRYERTLQSSSLSELGERLGRTPDGVQPNGSSLETFIEHEVGWPLKDSRMSG